MSIYLSPDEFPELVLALSGRTFIVCGYTANWLPQRRGRRR
jgi:hypothetical protein